MPAETSPVNAPCGSGACSGHRSGAGAARGLNGRSQRSDRRADDDLGTGLVDGLGEPRDEVARFGAVLCIFQLAAM